jgi:hypothetical protein
MALREEKTKMVEEERLERGEGEGTVGSGSE